MSHHSLAGSIGAYTKWANCADTTAATAPGRQAFLSRFEKQVDPDGTLSSAERGRRATAARKAYFKRLALKSAQSRSKAKELTAAADAADAELSASSPADISEAC